MVTVVLAAVLLAAGLAWLVTTVVGGRMTRDAARSAVTASLSGHTAFQQHRFRQLQLISRIFATDPVLTGYLAAAAASRDTVKVLDLVEAYQNLLTFDLAIVLDGAGTVVARTDRPEQAGEDLSATAMIAEALAEDRAFGVWSEGQSLYHAAVLPLVRDFRKVGHVLVALAIDDALATQVRRVSGADVAYLSLVGAAPTRVAGTLDRARTGALIEALTTQSGALARASERGETVDGLALELDRGGVIAALTPLRDAAERSVGLMIAATDPAAAAAGFGQIKLALLAGAALALIAGAALAWMVARGHLRPQQQLAAAAETLAAGDLETRVPDDLPGGLAPAGDALSALAAELRGRHSLDAVLAEAARRLPEPGQAAAERPRAETLTLLALELRGFANARTGYDPEETVDRFGRDLRRVAHAIEARQGGIVAVSGHRVLARFAGDDGARRALAAAAESIRGLSERENVFDEPEPPAVAMAEGTAVAGSVAWGEGTGRVLLGLPVQQLESLLREAAPGEIYLSKGIYEALAELLAATGETLQPQRGVLSTQPLYILSGELAAQAVALPATPLAAAEGNRRQLTDVAIGTVLGGRFEVLARIGTGPHGVVFKARDRERDRFVGLRLLRPEAIADPRRLEQLTSRIRVVRSIEHRHVVGVWDVGEVEGLAYVMMDSVRAMSLRAMLEALGRLPPRAAARLARQVASGVAAGHALKMPHLALKPDNVLIDAAGLARVADYGLAALGTGIDGGTSLFLAPEQLEALGTPGPACDVWAIGALLFTMLAGRPPFAAATPTELRARQESGDIEGLDELPAALAEIVARCLERDPAARYATAEPLAAALAAVRI